MTKVATFPIFLSSGEVEEYISRVNTISFSIINEEMICKAINYHLEGNIAKAKAFYENFLHQGLFSMEQHPHEI